MITDTNELRLKLSTRLAEIECLIGKGRSRMVMLTPLPWYQKFVNWVRNNEQIPPLEIDCSSLLFQGQFDPTKQWKKDYNVFEESIWDSIQGVFTCKDPIFRRLTCHPATGQSVILTKPIVVEFVTPSTTMIKNLGHDWQIMIMKRHLCIAIKVVAANYDLCAPDGTVIDDKMTVEAYHDMYGQKVFLKQKNEDYKNHDLTPWSSTLPSLPSPEQLNKLTPLKLNVKELLDSAPQRNELDSYPKPVGLINLGNTCYLNSALQSIIHIKQLYSFILSPKFDSSVNKKNNLGSNGKVAYAYRDLVRSMCISGTNPRNPKEFRNAFVTKFSSFANYDQHDAQEALGNILDCLHEDLAFSTALEDGVTPRTQSVRKRYPGTKPSYIESLFSGMFYSTINCPECHREQVVYDPFTFLSLPVKVRFFSGVTLVDCLKNFIQQDTLDENNKWKCDNCKQMVCAAKTIGIERCSKFLIIHFKRFEFDGIESKKIVTNVQYPDELDLSDFCKNDRGKLKLISVVFHIGNASSGHYTCASREEGTDKWYYYNDTIVNPIDQEKAHSEDAYMLIYQKI